MLTNKKGDRSTLVLASFTAAYTALVCGLKLDGHTALPWTLLLSPVWFPLVAILFFAVCWLALATVILTVEKIIRKLRGGL